MLVHHHIDVSAAEVGLEDGRVITGLALHYIRDMDDEDFDIKVMTIPAAKSLLCSLRERLDAVESCLAKAGRLPTEEEGTRRVMIEELDSEIAAELDEEWDPEDDDEMEEV